MYRVPKSSGNIYSTEDTSEGNNGCNNDSSDSEVQQHLESLSREQQSSCSCTDSHPLFSHRWRNAQLPCPPKKSLIRLIFNLLVLSLITPFCLVKKVCCPSSSTSWAQKIFSFVLLFVFVFGVIYTGLLDGSKYEIFGEKWRDFSICDLIQGETKDLRSLMKANRILERKALEIPPLKQQVETLQSQLNGLRSGVKGITHLAVSEVLGRYTSKGIATWSVEKELKRLMQKLDEDYVQMPDYALKSAGASIVQSRTTRSYHHDGGKYFWMSFILLPFVKSPDVILQPNYYPGNCWSFPGNQGETVVKLAEEIIPRAVTIDHIPKTISPTGEISSALKDFAIYGLKEENEKQGTFLGQFVYDIEGDFIQTFQLKSEFSEFMGYIKLKVLKNWGHPNYTCIYRFRVHGDISY
ncbi:SUN domain-containing protein 3 [Hemicordylus capensis]|uniref:SUN domain-containing protein 3 n=1 Tax=Hemicordylus capensis TaxID=884348 RepID=UPI0023028144|nr:SUN domain-containing protein 3 [Hemicordylus capensis]XP_053116229.1 SUN domain-containing protein 3 [Hemicordylus capensis]XP_053116230.1 SUN domain-containing protein 3 [Hemicordylus capensis]XP_053116231.1 SUN domain-containing protein 3 [Hemicordylus capensis]XP_053116232.1 SUN domain-containing protein 3 [Hemicordylus capensis]XP_053116233.1 SUN domain-containing protein 3 [Hemicordylus capensis]